MSGADDRETMIWNERRKLQALFLNNLAVSVVILGVVTPSVAVFYGLGSAPTVGSGWLAGGALGSAATGLGLHLLAASWLRGLR